MRLALALLLATLAALASAPLAAAHHPGAGGGDLAAPHGDPRSALPDSLITAPVAQAEMAEVPLGTFAAAGPELPATWCGTETTANETTNQTVSAGQAHFKLIYAHASDQPNRFADWAGRLQATVSLLGRYLATQSGERKALRWDMGTSCATSPQRYVDIQVVHLPNPLSHYNTDVNARFTRLNADVRAAMGLGSGYPGAGPRNFVVYADAMFKGTNGSGIGGEASRFLADGVNTTAHSGGGLTAAVYGPQTAPSNGYAWPATMLHEISHNLGAVQDTAPNTSGAGHCDDRFDVMCYPDGGASYVETQPCARIAGVVDETLDCNGDDYFNPEPAAGSYLATHWNTYRAAHLAPCSESYRACGVAPPAVDVVAPANTTPAASSAWRTSAYSVALNGTDAESDVDGWEWQVDADPVQATRVASVATDGLHVLRTRVRDSAGNWSAWRSDTVRVDQTPPAAAHDCPAGWRAIAASCSLSATDSGSGVAQLRYRLGEGTEQVLNAATGLVPVTAGGETVVAVRAVDAAGNVSPTASATVRIDLSPPTVALACTPLDGPRHRCTPSASDAHSGVAELRLVRDAVPGAALADGQAFEVEGPADLAVIATDGVGRAATSATVKLPGASSTTTGTEIKTAPATTSGTEDTGGSGDRTAALSPTTPAAPAKATGRTIVKAGRRALGIGVLDLLADASGRRAVADLRVSRLPKGTWRLEICVRGARCTRKTVKRRRPGAATLRTQLTVPAGEARATFTVYRKRSGSFRRHGRGTASATLD